MLVRQNLVVGGSRRAFDEEQALDAAVEVFWEHGYHGASLDMLCGAMGIGRQSLYAWLGDKRQLFLAALRRYEQTVTPPVVWQMLEDGADGRASVLQLMRTVADNAKRNPGRGCVLTTSLGEFAGGDETIRKAIDDQLDLFRKAVTKALRAAKRNGDLPDGVAVAPTANMLVVMRNGIMLAGRAGTADSGLDAILSVVERHLGLDR